MARDLHAVMEYKDIRVEILAEGASWNPDVADDVVRRLAQMFLSTLKAVMEHDCMCEVEDEEEEAELEAETTESTKEEG
jgi:hypothetical protein